MELEKRLRSKEDIELDDQLMEDWFALVYQRNQLLRKEAGIVYTLRDLELIEQHDELEKEIRRRLEKDGGLPGNVLSLIHKLARG